MAFCAATGSQYQVYVKLCLFLNPPHRETPKHALTKKKNKGKIRKKCRPVGEWVWDLANGARGTGGPASVFLAGPSLKALSAQRPALSARSLGARRARRSASLKRYTQHGRMQLKCQFASRFCHREQMSRAQASAGDE
jgi:hypothetical protein